MRVLIAILLLASFAGCARLTAFYQAADTNTRIPVATYQARVSPMLHVAMTIVGPLVSPDQKTYLDGALTNLDHMASISSSTGTLSVLPVFLSIAAPLLTQNQAVKDKLNSLPPIDIGMISMGLSAVCDSVDTSTANGQAVLVLSGAINEILYSSTEKEK